MGIGQRHQVQLVQILSSQDGAGCWQEYDGQKFGVWAELSNPSGFRAYEHGQTQLGQTKNFLIRFRFDKYPNCNWKIIFRGKEWTISEREQVNEKRFYWRFTAQSKADV